MIFRAKGVLKRSKPRFTVSEWFSRSWEHEEAWSSRHEKWSGDVLVQEIGTGYNDMDARGLAEVRCSHRFESSRLTTMFRPTQRIGSGRNQGSKGPIPSGMTESKSAGSSDAIMRAIAKQATNHGEYSLPEESVGALADYEDHFPRRGQIPTSCS
jgi:hypothetical protein